jgi:hypothetical protein
LIEITTGNSERPVQTVVRVAPALNSDTVLTALAHEWAHRGHKATISFISSKNDSVTSSFSRRNELKTHNLTLAHGGDPNLPALNVLTNTSDAAGWNAELGLWPNPGAGLGRRRS